MKINLVKIISKVVDAGGKPNMCWMGWDEQTQSFLGGCDLGFFPFPPQ